MYYTHINRNVINKNRKYGTDEPAVRLAVSDGVDASFAGYQKGKYGEATYCSRQESASTLPKEAKEAALPDGSRIIYRPSGTPLLPCGARLVIVSEEAPEVIS